MKRIISALIICAMLCATLLAIIPVSAANATKEDLAAKIAEAEALDSTNYSDKSWAALQAALKTAKETYEKADADPANVNLQYSALNDAIVALKVDTSAIDNIINRIKQVENDSNEIKKNGYPQGDYTEESWAALQTAIDDAKLAKASNDIETVKAGAVALQAAFDALEYNPVPEEITKKIADLLELADLLIPEEWPDAAWGMVDSKVKQAKAVANDKRLSANVTAANQLDTALRNLDPDKELPKPPVLDYVYIDGLFDHIDSFSPDMFTAESWAELKKVYDEVKKVRETSKKQAEINDAAVKLYNAQKKLVLAPEPVETDPPATQPVATTPADDTAGGCGGTIAIGATVVVAVLGTAIVLKKKDN